MKNLLFLVSFIVCSALLSTSCFSADGDRPDDKWVFQSAHQADAGATEYRVGEICLSICNPSISVSMYENVEKGQCSGRKFRTGYDGEQAMSYIKQINTMNFSSVSLHRRIMNTLESDAVIPAGAPASN